MTEKDKRYQRTHARIRAVFEELVLTHSFHEITVSEIARLVGINRKTFYAHYDSTAALLADLVRELVEEFRDSEALSFDLCGTDGGGMLEPFFRILSRREALHRRLICSPDYLFTFHMVADSLAEENAAHADAVFDGDAFLRHALTVFFSGSVMQVYREWLLADKPISEKELAAFLELLMLGSLKELQAARAAADGDGACEPAEGSERIHPQAD